MLNTTIATGRLTRDPETKNTTAGKPFAVFSVAVDNGYGDNKETLFYDCSAFGKTGEFVVKNLTKGELVSFEGRPSLRAYLKKDGTPGASINISINQVHFSGAKKSEDNNDFAQPALATSGNVW